jgi:serine protease SohB
VIEFEGDIRATQVDNLREEVTAVLSVANTEDEVLVSVESPGGMVHAYGLAASQLARFREHNIPLTVCIDKVAASGGYLMACTANEVLAAPFAVVGSTGVLAQVPNFNKLLKKNDIDYEEMTAGEYKRTISFLGEITDKGRQKFTEQLEETHGLFKAFIKEFRPQVDLEKVATGEHWLGKHALELKLVDGLKTSDEFILSRCEKSDIYKVKMHTKKKLMQALSEAMGETSSKVMEKGLEWIHNSRLMS